ncbi:AAA family ATPase [Nocardioides okcheonensis]|uniref:AAA family ATPase n=1 Tax=Nocardioides okcheonensis TaxID=2894081 RepID=UPI001E55D6F0|nr:AAA family ATPase [Nocardioides okcheonensis]UFN45179.1 AAA family ATPase [Nocardioides okcheonensis]
MRELPVFVMVSGPPASGKSTLAPELAAALRLPLVAKDTIKETLMATLPVPDVEASRQLGRAAVQVMLAVSAASPVGAVLESNFYRSLAVAEIQQLPGTVVEVFCRCDRQVAQGRFATRVATRQAGHFDGLRTAEELWNEQISEPVAGGWPVLEVDTNSAVDVPFVTRRLRQLLDT